MSIISGNFSLIRFKIHTKISADDLVKGLNTFRANDALTFERPESFGWAVGFNFLETKFNLEDIEIGGYYYFALRHTFKKVPNSLVKAYCQQEEIRVLKKTKKERLSRFEKSEIRSQIREKLFLDQPIEYKVHDCVLEKKTGILYFTATSKKNIQEFIRLFELSFDITPQLLNTTGLANGILGNKEFKILNLKTPAKYTSLADHEIKEVPLEEFLGGDFMTWLWYHVENNRQTFQIDKSTASVAMEGFVVLKSLLCQSTESFENIIKDGDAFSCPETAIALYGGKRLMQTKMVVVIEDNMWSFRVDATNFMMSGLKLPSVDPERFDDQTEGRMQSITELFEVWDQIFIYFLEDYLNEDWEKVETQVCEWVKQKKTRALKK